MFIFKLGLLTCVFYALLTLLLEVIGWALVHSQGFMWIVPTRHFWLRLGFFWGVVFGVVWLISFILAWSIVYPDLKARFGILLR